MRATWCHLELITLGFHIGLHIRLYYSSTKEYFVAAAYDSKDLLWIMVSGF